MPRKRNPENKGFPPRWKKEGNTIYYQVPRGQEDKWDGKKKFRLGRTISEASAEWAKRVNTTEKVATIADLLTRYEIEVIPLKKPSSQEKDRRSVKRLREVFGVMRLDAVKPRHVYMYMDKKSKKRQKGSKVVGGAVTAKHEIMVLSHAYTKAIKWGLIDAHPFKGNIVFEKQETRERYLEDWEIMACLSLGRVSNSITAVVQSYIRFKLLTALRQNDILKIRIADLKDDGIHVKISKTGKPIIIKWSDALREEVEIAKRLRPIDISPLLFCTREGKCYYDEQTGKATGWTSIWRRFVDRVLAETEVKERFVDSDIRAKAATDVGNIRAAQRLLNHSNIETTKKHYMRLPTTIKPTK